ncbi:MAG: NADP-dependent phosphogluconate dehydrogenase [Bacteroidota bacterium]
MSDKKYQIGMVGLGTMGCNLVMNMADHGFSVAGYDRDPAKVDSVQRSAGDRQVQGAKTLQEFIGLLQTPRAIILLVPAGAPVDSVINEFLPLLEKGDLLIDSGNSHFVDTSRRTKDLTEKGYHFMGMGISGGEEGARFGPSLMPGGPKDGYDRVRPVLEAVSAKVNNEPCVAYMGPGAAGHYVKMVHNGIEYGLMQLLSETYDLLKTAGLSEDELHQTYAEWNQSELQSFLVEITSEIFLQVDEKTGDRLVNKILDRARSKGTGKWTSQDAMDLNVPIPTIDASVSMRALSALKDQRVAAAKVLPGPRAQFSGDKAAFVKQVKSAMYFATVISYAQGLVMLQEASKTYEFNLQLEDVARIWRGGCIIRAALLEPIRAAFANNPSLPNLLVDPTLSKEVLQRQNDTREVIKTAVEWGLSIPCLMSSLAYFDAYRTERLASNLVQAQRDKFGAHTYERIDETGIFHTEWNK